MARIRRTACARQDLADIWTFLAQDNVVAADRMLLRLGEIFTMLASQPHMGRDRGAVRPGMRSHVAGSYVVFYQPTDGGSTSSAPCTAPATSRLPFRSSPFFPPAWAV